MNSAAQTASGSRQVEKPDQEPPVSDSGQGNPTRCVSSGLASRQSTVTDVQHRDCLLSLSFPYKKGDTSQSFPFHHFCPQC
jgi:hypothetical protein